MTIANPRRFLTCVLLLLFCTQGFASPVGTEFELLLDGLFTNTDIDGPFEDTEGHLGFVTFDDSPDIVPNDLVPVSPAEPGNDLVVTEMVLPGPGPSGGEVIAIWVEADGAPGTPLFNNDIDVAVLFNIEGIYWVDGIADSVQILDLYLTFEAADDLGIDPVFVDISGAGTESDPLYLMFELDPDDFAGSPTDLHLEFEVTHAPVPIPGALLLMSSALAALAARRRFAV